MLRRRDSGESDRLLTLLTQERGKINVIAKGARKGSSRLAGSSEPLTHATFSLATTHRFPFVTQAQPKRSFPEIRSDYDKLLASLALLECTDALTTFDQPVDDLFAHLLASLEFMGKATRPGATLVWALVRMLEIEGLAPQWIECAISGEPLVENPALFSYSAGGYVRSEHSANLPDKFRVPAEALIGLSRIGNLDEPPQNLKFLLDCQTVLVRIVRDAGHQPLPSFATYLEAVRESE